MSKEKKIIVGTFHKGIFTPHVVCEDMAIELEGQQVAFTVLTAEPEKVRTHQERKAIEVYCSRGSKICIDAGIGVRALISALRADTEMPMTPKVFKEVFYKIIAFHMFGVKTTTKLEKCQPHDVWRECDRVTSARLGFSVPWPSSKPPLMRDYD